MTNDRIEIRIFAYGKNGIYPIPTYHYCSSHIPRIGESVSIQYWNAKIVDAQWCIFDNGKQKYDCYCDVSDIEEDINFNLPPKGE